MEGITDKRSPLAKALGHGIAWERLVVEQGRLASAGLDLAVRWLPEDVQASAPRRAVRALTVGEDAWRDELLYTELGEAVYDLETQVQVVARALIVAPPAGTVLTEANCTPALRDADEVRRTLDADEVRAVHTAWLRFQRSRSPITYAASAEEVEGFVDALGKGMLPPSRLRTCEPDTLLAIATCMASRLSSQTSSSSSPTSPSTAPSGGSATPSASTPSSESETPTRTIEVVSPSKP